jgi:hypothetical protein
MPDFFQAAPDPAADPQGFAQQRALAQMLMKRTGGTPGQQGVAAPVGQLAGGLAAGYMNNKLADAQRASTILQSGTADPTRMQQAGQWLGSLFGGR